MKISEMHVWFRQYAQQMGMQNVRAILPEQIDNLINTSIKDTIDEVISRNIGLTNDRVITDNSKIGSVNALRTLYRVKTLTILSDKVVADYKDNPYTFDSTNLDNPYSFIDFSIRYTNKDYNFNPPGTLSVEEALNTLASHKTWIDELYSNFFESEIEPIPDYNKFEEIKGKLSDLVDFAKELLRANNIIDSTITALENEITASQYEASTVTNTCKDFIQRSKEVYYDKEIGFLNSTIKYTRWFPVRIVEEAYLADILNDFVLAPRMRTPAMIVFGKEDDNINSNFELYIGENEESSIAPVAKKMYIGEIRCSYIKTPNKVAYVSDIDSSENNVDCDLPEQLHIPVLKHAVDLYRASIQGSLFAAQEQNTQQQRENVRNNARPDNEGYQS